jgi:hypothetical protein
LDDQSWYVTVVEFQPSGFSKGSYLNVGAHFLWQWSGHYSFDFKYRVNGFVSYQSDEEFLPAIDSLALAAAEEVLRTRTQLSSPAAVADLLPVGPPDRSWVSYHRAMSLALDGRAAEAAVLFDVLSQPAPESSSDEYGTHEMERAKKCAEIAGLVANPEVLRVATIRLIAAQRQSLRLNALSHITL